MAKLFEKRGVSVMPSTQWRTNSFSTWTSAGINVTPEVALQVTAFFAAVRFRSFAVGSLPKILYQRTSGGKRRVIESPLYGILHDEPNEYMSAFDLWAMMDAHVMIRGNAYAEIAFDNKGQVTGLWPLRPDRMKIAWSDGGELQYIYELPEKFDNKKVELRPEQVLHLRGLTLDGVCGVAPITSMRNAVALAKATEEYGATFFGNGANPGVVLKHPARLNDDIYKRVKEDWEQMHQGLDNAHRVAILEQGMDVAQVGLSPEDSQFLQTRTFQLSEIARMTDVPPNFIFELSQSNYSTLEQMTLDFVVHHLRPVLVSYEQTCSRSLLLQSEKDAGWFVENLIDGLLRGDLATRYNAYSIGRQNGWLSINDVRRLENMNSIGTKGDGYIVPLNMSVLGEDGMPMPVPSDSQAAPNTPARTLEAGPDLRGIFLRDAADRMGRRELNEYTNARRKNQNEEKMRAWVEQFYKRDYPQFMLQVAQPFIDAGLLNEIKTKRAIAAYCEMRGQMALNDDLTVYEVGNIVTAFEESVQ